jgi:hypothetical protein
MGSTIDIRVQLESEEEKHTNQIPMIILYSFVAELMAQLIEDVTF